jgi:F-box/TPR repeat protein Pof3
MTPSAAHKDIRRRIANNRQDQIISCTPNLQCASLIHQDSIFGPRNMYEFADFSMWSKLQHLEVTHAFFTTLAWLPPTLKHLYVTESHVSGFSAENEDLSPLGLPLLETYMCGAMDLSLEMIMAVITSSVKAGNLKALHMVNYHPNRTTLWAQPTLANDLLMPSVQELSLSKCDMHEDNIVKFLRLFPNLQTLDLSLTKITGVAVKEVMTREIGPLKWLGLNGCTKLSADAVEWARSLGTVVEYSNNPVKKPAGQRLWRDRLA